MKEFFGTTMALLIVFKLADIGSIGGWSWFQVLTPVWIWLLVVTLLVIINYPKSFGG